MRSIRGIGAAALLGSAILGVHGGNLDPPGAPGSTPGPEPRIAVNQQNTPGDGNSRFRITSPGSYYLTANITLGSALNGIEIGASNVTLDLNGFALRRSFIIANPPLDGIVADSDLRNITVRNGMIDGFSRSGIDLFMANLAVVENMTVRSSGDDGISCGDDSTVRDCLVEGNGKNGILVDERSQVLRCTANNSGGDGIDVRSGSIVRECMAQGNGGNGIAMTNRGLCVDNSCANNSAAGISLVGQAHRVERNLLRGNDVGIDTGGYGGNLIVGNASFASTSMAFNIAPNNYEGARITNPANVPNAGAWANFSD